MGAVDCGLDGDFLADFEVGGTEAGAELLDGAGEFVADGDRDCFFRDGMWGGG